MELEKAVHELATRVPTAAADRLKVLAVPPPEIERRIEELPVRRVGSATRAAVIRPMPQCEEHLFAVSRDLELLHMLGQLFGLLVFERPAAERGPAPAKGIRRDIRIIGCEPARADDAYRSLATGTLQSQDSSDTIADGLRASLSPRTFAILRRHVERILLVTEEEIISTARLVWERMKIIIEPSSAVALAPLLKPSVVASLTLPPRPDGRVAKLGVIFSGGNVDLNALPWLP